MTEPPIEDNPSDDVLEELLGAFSVDSRADGAAIDPATGEPDGFDFDDPSIDRLLGITAEQPVVKAAPASVIEPKAANKTPRFKREKSRSKKEKPDAAKPEQPKPPRKDYGERPTIIIGGDELPDAVALDVEREEKFLDRRVEKGNKERSTIVIADFDEVAPLDATAVRSSMGGGGGGAGSADQRIRARRVAVRRAEGRRRLRWIVIGLVAIALPVGTLAALASPLFDVSNVTVQGAAYTDPTLLAAVIADITGDPVLLVDTKAIEERLRADPWVESVKVETDFPHAVHIDVRERRPVAAFQGGDGRFRIIDYEGRVLDVIDGIPIDYMLITGDHPDTARGQFAGAPYSAAAELVLGLPSEIRAITDSVGLNAATGALSLQLESNTTVQLGDASDLDRKLARLLTHVRAGVAGVCEVDVSTSEVGIVPC
ncbi:MAG: FtsQ-type POTRA domain-containing protein [Actinomycetia bacterium]|nr:FtsQ-type POTRA domain-containing protein [Actinomycetes bacterium]